MTLQTYPMKDADKAVKSVKDGSVRYRAILMVSSRLGQNRSAVGMLK